MDFKDYYAVLGVARKASDKEIRRAYRRLAREHHPDVNPDDADAAERFRAISEAYEVLSDPAKRELYDRHGEQWRDAQRAGEQGVDFAAWQRAQSTQHAGGGPGGPQYTYATAEDLEELFGEARYSDFFESLFGQAARGARRAGPRRGRNIDAPVTISLAEAFSGTRRTIEKDGRRLELSIPPGVRTGSRVRMRGEGAPGAGGGAAGDLYLVVTVAPDPRFTRDSDDLETVVPVPLLVAMLGGEVAVPTLSGDVKLRIPGGTQNNARIRLSGRGMPHLKGAGQGDLYARVDLRLPADLSAEERTLLEQWRELRGERQ